MLLVTPQGFEPRFSGPKPLVLPLDERAIYVRSPITPNLERFKVIYLYFKSQASLVHEPDSVLSRSPYGNRTRLSRMKT